MPTMHGTIFAQYVGWRWLQNSIIDTVDIFPNNRDITAEAAFTLINVNNKKSFWIECGISRVVSNGVLETFDPPLPRILRHNVTQLTFRSASTSGLKIRVRQVISYWT